MPSAHYHSVQKWRLKYPEKARALAARTRGKYYVQFQEWLAKVKDSPCMDCGIKYPSYVMQFDHRDPGQKVFALGRSKGLAPARIEAELAKCDLVCANCHMERTYQRRQVKGT